VEQGTEFLNWLQFTNVDDIGDDRTMTYTRWAKKLHTYCFFQQILYSMHGFTLDGVDAELGHWYNQ